MNTINITNDEAAVIASLLKLYDAAYDEAGHERDCGCKLCSALELAGEHDYRLFDSLAYRTGYNNK